MRRTTPFIRSLNSSCIRLGAGKTFYISQHPRWTYSVGYRGTNQTGLRILPGGIRAFPSGDIQIGENAYLATSTRYNDTNFYAVRLDLDSNAIVVAANFFLNGVYARCCRDYQGNARDLTVFKDAYTDGSGNKYDAVKIGNKLWTTTNLKTTKYQDGTAIQYRPLTEWFNPNLYSGYGWYGNDSATYGVYGALYAHHVLALASVVTGYWRIPSRQDYLDLQTYLVNKQWCEGSPITTSNIAQYIKSGRQNMAINPYIRFTSSQDSTSISYLERTISFTLSSTHWWTAVIRQGSSWISMPKSGVAGTYDIDIDVEQNGITDRVGYIDFYSEGEMLHTFKISQTGEPVDITLSPSKVNIDTAGGLVMISVTSTHYWTASYNATWLTFPTSGNIGTSNNSLWIQGAVPGDSRHATITFMISGTIKATLLVTQSDFILDPIIL